MKEEIREDLIKKARELLVSKGLDYLTARKLADYSGYSVGTIYNQFKSMDNLILVENSQTLDELFLELSSVDFGSDAYYNLNKLLDKFVDFVFKNKRLWFTLYHFHFINSYEHFDIFYLRRIFKVIKLLDANLYKLFMNISPKEREVCSEVLFTTLFAFSSLLTAETEFARLEKKYVVRVLFNTYLAGMSHLSK